jgi:cytochrome b561
MALLIIGLFILGVYMVDLDYYSKWYIVAPLWHKAVGMLVFFLLFFRVGWVLINTRPLPLSNYKKWERVLAKITHVSFYVLLFVVSVSGYFITTAKGASIDIFGWFEIAAITKIDSEKARIVGELHELFAYLIAFLFVLHVGATIKHHFIDKDTTLLRILKPNKPKESSK